MARGFREDLTEFTGRASPRVMGVQNGAKTPGRGDRHRLQCQFMQLLNSVSDRIFGRHGRVRLLCLAPIAIHYESQLDARRLICIGTKRDTAMLT